MKNLTKPIISICTYEVMFILLSIRILALLFCLSQFSAAKINLNFKNKALSTEYIQRDKLSLN